MHLDCLDKWKSLLAFPYPNLSCAVVGSSDILRFYPMQKHINKADIVWRINHAPTQSFETLVGNYTSIRISNHVLTDNWNGKLRPKKGEYSGFGKEFRSYDEMCGKNMCISISKTRYPMLTLGDEEYRQFKKCEGHSISTGMLVVSAALRSCSGMVTLFGFFPACCNAQTMYPGMNYKYYHTNVSSWVCCAKGREDMVTEYANYISHPRIRIHTVDLHLGASHMPTCAVVGSAWTKKRYGAQIDTKDVVYRVNHAPTRGYEDIVGLRTDVRTFGDETLLISMTTPIDCGRTVCKFIRKYGDLDRYYRNSNLRLGKTYNITSVDDNFTRYIITFKSQFTKKHWKKIKVSGGLATVLYALERCSHVDIYLIEYMQNKTCCRTHAPYNYYMSKYKINKCCEKSREGNDEEMAWQELISRGNVTVHDVT